MAEVAVIVCCVGLSALTACTIPRAESRFPVRRVGRSETWHPVNLTIEGRAKTQDYDMVNEAVSAEDWMQAFFRRQP